jgi:gamma-glutamylaminecyclotransferase
MARRIFVYGTLKQGFCNFGVNAGRRLPGVFETVERFPLYVIGAPGLPWLVDTAGEGHRVAGQLFDVDDADLPRMDALERIDQPGWYARSVLQVVPAGGSSLAALEAEAYFGCRSRLAIETVRLGPLAEYTLAHQALYRGRST